MKFVDEVRIHVKAGDGGNGAVAWRREYFTVPSTSAKSVKSFPIPTFGPGWTRVPTCRTRILPAATFSDP